VETVGTEAAQRALREALGASYALERELGRGGMATIYLARDLRHRRAVAVKLLHPELSAVLGPSGSSGRSSSPRTCSTRTSCRCSTQGAPAGCCTT
jgi:serine/threonine protein kinase